MNLDFQTLLDSRKKKYFVLKNTNMFCCGKIQNVLHAKRKCFPAGKYKNVLTMAK
jgi:hypothetical protein